MKIFVLTSDPNDGSMIEATDLAITNGHEITTDPAKADLVIVADDVKARVNVVGHDADKRTSTYYNFINWSHRTFLT
jgi:hypothetical protein